MERVIELPFRVKRPILACGADLKGAFALVKGRKAFLVDGFGDLSDLDNLTGYEKSVKRHIKKLGIKPAIIACDLHPDYYSTRFAEYYTLSDRNLLRKFHRYTLYKIQHHEAHVASAIIDNALSGRVIGVAFDGAGFGPDGNIWGGEFFTGGIKDLKRAAHFEYAPMPGGDMAVKEPRRMAIGHLYKIFGRDFLKLKIEFVKKIKKRNKAHFLMKMIDRNINSPLTSSAGRLFDAAGSLILCRETIQKEAELPIELENIADRSYTGSYGFGMDTESREGGLIIKTAGIMKGIIKDLASGEDSAVMSARFHNTMAHVIARASDKLRRKSGINKVVLSGGVFQNRLLTARVKELLDRKDFKVYTHSNVPTNDAGIAVGQAAIANARALCA